VKETVIVALALQLSILCACTKRHTNDKPRATGDTTAVEGPSAVATWQGGSLFFAELEASLPTKQSAACLKARSQAGGGSLDELEPCYEELARALALEALVRTENPLSEKAVLAHADDPFFEKASLSEFATDAAELRRTTFERLYLRQLITATVVSDEEINAELATDPSGHRRPATVTLFNIFRRHEARNKPDKTIEFLNSLKKRFLAGERWEVLAKRHSHSETRSRGGAVGRVSKGRLPRHLDEVAFSLQSGGVSEPILVPGGGVLLHVRELTHGAERAAEEKRRVVEIELKEKKIREHIAELVADAAPPPDSFVMRLPDVLEALDSSDLSATILQIGSRQLSVAQLRRAAGIEPMVMRQDLDGKKLATVEELYLTTQRRWMLPYVLTNGADRELARRVDEELRKHGVSAHIDHMIWQTIKQEAAADTARLRAFWHDNQHHFQTSLRLHIRHWHLPFDENPPAQLAAMEKIRARLEAGALALETAVAELGGEIKDLGWVDHASIVPLFPPKAVTYLSEIGSNGFSVPYQQAKALHLIHLLGRDEPKRKAFEACRDDVLEAYVRRFAQDLYRAFEERKLRAASFQYNAKEVRKQLTQPI
jgi:SOS response regulatory protein OraA/RecX